MYPFFINTYYMITSYLLQN